nr:helitron helicase-like domain-containing protein [Tanacetum cinerariifolium]
MTGIHYTSPSGDGLCGGHHFDVMALRDSIVTSDGNELPRAGVKNVNVGIEGRAPLSIETCEMMDTTNVPVSTVFERFRNVRLNSFGSHYLSQSAPLNHAYLCLNVTDGVVRPEIVPFTNTRPGTTHEGNGYRENTRHTGGLFQQNEVFSITPMSDTSSLGTRSMRRSSTNGRTPSYIDLGDCDQQCRHCGCLFWYNERIRNNNCGRRVEYHLCCEGGKIYMRPTPDLPVFIQQFLTNSHFMEHIRAYNQMFAMTSFGAKVDDTVNNGKGPYVFKVSGQIYHWIGFLLSGRRPPLALSATLYLRHTGRSSLEQHVTGITQVKYRDSKFGYYNNGGTRGYELLNSDVLGGIVFEDGPKSRTDFDVIIEF